MHQVRSVSVGAFTRADTVGSRGRHVGISLEKNTRADIWLLRSGSAKFVSGAAESGNWRPRARRKLDCGGRPVYRRYGSWGILEKQHVPAWRHGGWECDICNRRGCGLRSASCADSPAAQDGASSGCCSRGSGSPEATISGCGRELSGRTPEAGRAAAGCF